MVDLLNVNTANLIYNIIAFIPSMEIADGENMIPFSAESLIILDGKVVMIGAR